jgi:protein-L-isoaspartate(D-aspartate) O-methyltransferase
VARGPEDLVRDVVAVGVVDARILDAMRAVPRADFVSPEHRQRAYIDQPLPIPHGQVTTQPSLVAKMVEALRVGPDACVLEVGTGLGFQTAILTRLARKVYSIERFRDIADTARTHLRRFGASNVDVVVGDGSLGRPEEAPYDAIVVSAAFLSVPAPLAEQLAEGGRLVQPIGPGGADDVKVFEKSGGGLIDRGFVIGAHFVRLYGRHGFSEESETE